MSVPQIDFGHSVISRDVVNRALGEYPSNMEYRDLLRHLPDEAHVVLYGEDADSLTVQFVHEFARLVRLVRRHPCRRFIQKEKGGLESNSHTDLQPLLLAMAEIASKVPTLLIKPQEYQ